MDFEDDREIDMICQHSKDGSIIPIKMKMLDDDGESHIYRVNAYRPLEVQGCHVMPNGVPVGNTIWAYECIISVFGVEKVTYLFYNTVSGKWTLRFRRF